jgi:TolA-binding protein
VLAALLLAGIAAGAAVALSGGDSSRGALQPQKVSVSVRTGTQPGTTVVTTAPAAPPTTTAAASGDPYALNNQAWELMKQGDYASALPLLENAVQQLQGRTDLGTAYANYNLGVTLISLGRCSEAMPYLETSKAIQPSRHEVKDALKQARHCSG